MKKTWIYGPHSVAALLDARPASVSELLMSEKGGARLRGLAARTKTSDIKLTTAPDRMISQSCGSRDHQGIAAKAPLPEYAEIEQVMEATPNVVLVLDSITDERNLGSCIRSAEALGASGIVIPENRSAGMSPVVHKASAGAVEWLPVCRVKNLSRALREMKDKGYWIFAAVTSRGKDLDPDDVTERAALIVGSEGRGVRPGVLRQADFRIKIPMKGKTKSLNVSAASAIMVNWLLKSKAPE